MFASLGVALVAMLTVMCFDWFLGPLFKRENSSFQAGFAREHHVILRNEDRQELD